MLLPRVTMQQVAKAAGVHQTTVSLALRNDPQLPEKTRARIRRIADQLGYRPDPMLSALHHYRSGLRVVHAPTTMAFVYNFADRDEMMRSYPHRLFLEGAQKQAELIGYRLETFYAGHKPNAGSRLERVLRARGIAGLIIAAFGDRTIEFKMDWSQFSAVVIESQQLGLPLHMISNHQMAITREVVQRLRALGYRRIGLAVGELEENYLRNAFTAGYFVELGLHPELVHLPPQLLPPPGVSVKELASIVAPWVERHEIEVVASNWAEIPDALRLAGWRVPADIVVASLDVKPHQGANAGMEQNHRVVGERAVEQLAILMRTNRRGIAVPHNNTLIEGRWVDGSDIPRRAGRPRKRRHVPVR